MLDQVKPKHYSHSIAFYDFHPQFDSMLNEVSLGLSKNPKQLPPKYFYDSKGSSLFDKICELDEYYPTRTEIGILKQYQQEISDFAGDNATLIELGSGSSTKIRILLDAMKPKAYIPIDISKDHLINASQKLASDFPWLDVHAACIDYSRAWEMPYEAKTGSKVAFFPGSSIGNFEPQQAVQLLEEIHTLIGQGGKMIIGVDRVKETKILEKAYNDNSGITARFNLNILSRINLELGATFDTAAFKHFAYFNKNKKRIEMHLISEKEQDVQIDSKTFHFEKNEKLHTESSYKYSQEDFIKLAKSAHMETV